MKKINKLLAIAAIMLLVVSCNGTKIIGPGTAKDALKCLFLEKETIIEVDKDVKSFQLVCELAYEPEGYENYFPARLDPDRTTAKHKVHFINKTTKLYDKRDGVKLYQEVEIIPENIVEEVKIVYYIDNVKENYEIESDSTVIILKPKVTNKK